MGKIFISISLALLVIFISTGCITIEQAPKPASPPSSQPEPNEPTSYRGDKPVIETFNVNSPLISPGETAILSWTVSGAESISIVPGIGEVESVGIRQVIPNESTLYTLTATNSAGTVNTVIEIKVETTQSIPQPTQETFAVIEVVIATEPSPDHCPEILYADITANGAGTVSYRWESADDGSYSYTFSVDFISAGTQRVTLFPQMRVLPSGMYQVRIMSPNEILSNTTHYTTCAP